MNLPRINRKPTRSAAASLRLLALLFLVAVVVPLLALHAGNPAWWANWGVLIPGAQPSDYAAVNQGQVKSIASLATQEFDAQLPGGAGAAVHALTDPWNNPSATTNDYQAINLGQLKNLAKPFYDRLIAVGYTNEYPWAGSSTPANDFATANIGQVKNLFSFDLTAVTPANDSNGDGIADWWEKYYFNTLTINPNAAAARGDGLTILQAFQQGLNPNDFYNGHPPTFTIVSGNGQTGPPGGFVPQALIVSVVDSSGNPIAGAPITFTVSQGGGQLQATSSSPFSTAINVLTASTGQAKAFFELPNSPSNSSQVIASTGNGSTAATATFTESSDNGSGTYGSPFDPVNVVGTINPDGSVDVSWTLPDPTDQESIDVRYRTASGGWAILTNVSAGTTSCHIPPP
jgi:hypothetical protein